MQANVPISDRFADYNARYREYSEKLLDGLEPDEPNALILADTVIVGPGATERPCMFILLEGMVQGQVDQNDLFYYEVGDMVGIDAFGNNGLATIRTEFAVRADVYYWDRLFNHIVSNVDRLRTLINCQTMHTALLMMILDAAMIATRRPDFKLQTFKPGETIICQGDSGSEVYSMLSGRAIALVDGKKVGEIKQDQIFGEMSRLTDQKRTATVKADTSCEVMVFSGEEFARIAATNPAALNEVAKNLAERLNAVNKTVTKLS